MNRVADPHHSAEGRSEAQARNDYADSELRQVSTGRRKPYHGSYGRIESGFSEDEAAE
jgi:hypothetical protein